MAAYGAGVGRTGGGGRDGREEAEEGVGEGEGESEEWGLVDGLERVRVFFCLAVCDGLRWAKEDLALCSRGAYWPKH